MICLAKLHFRVSPWMPFMALRLDGKNPRTQEVHRLPLPGYNVHWSVTYPESGEEIRTQFSDTPLTFDKATGFFVYSLSSDRLDEVLRAQGALPTKIMVEMPTGIVVPWATGTVTGEQLP